MPSFFSLVPIVISTLSTFIALAMLFMTRQDMNRREEKDQELFIDHIYQQFQEQKLAMLQDPLLLEVLARDREKSPEETRQAGLASIRINQAFRLFRLAEKQYIPSEQWEQLIPDVRLMFTRLSIQAQWEKVQGKYPNSFQQFVNEKL